jgi:hypothetical protein
MACEYGPIALGASSVLMTVRWVARGPAVVRLATGLFGAAFEVVFLAGMIKSPEK